MHLWLTDTVLFSVVLDLSASKSSVMYIDSRKAGNAQNMTIGGKMLNVDTYFSYLGHIICNDLSDDADLKAKAKSRQMERRGSVVECRTRNQGNTGSNPSLPPFRRWGIFVLSIDALVNSAV